MLTKIVLLGSSQVGKTTYIERLTSGNFLDKYISTKNIKPYIIGNYEMYDIPSKEFFKSFDNAYIKESKEAIIMFDITRQETFEEAKKYIEEYSKICPQSTITLVGNKKDEINNQRVTQTMIQELLSKHKNICAYTDMSCKGTPVESN